MSVTRTTVCNACGKGYAHAEGTDVSKLWCIGCGSPPGYLVRVQEQTEPETTQRFPVEVVPATKSPKDIRDAGILTSFLEYVWLKQERVNDHISSQLNGRVSRDPKTIASLLRAWPPRGGSVSKPNTKVPLYIDFFGVLPLQYHKHMSFWYASLDDISKPDKALVSCPSSETGISNMGTRDALAALVERRSWALSDPAGPYADYIHGGGHRHGKTAGPFTHQDLNPRFFDDNPLYRHEWQPEGYSRIVTRPKAPPVPELYAPEPGPCAHFLDHVSDVTIELEVGARRDPRTALNDGRCNANGVWEGIKLNDSMWSALEAAAITQLKRTLLGWPLCPAHGYDSVEVEWRQEGLWQRRAWFVCKGEQR